MKAEERAKHLTNMIRHYYSKNPGQVETDLGGDDEYNLGKIEEIIKRGLESYAESKLQALKEEVEELAEFRVKYFKIERMQNSDGTEVEAQAVLKEDVLNLITNLDDK